MNRRSDAARPERGFTLIELMVVVLVIAILLAIAVPTFLGARSRAQDAVAKTSLRTALSAAASALAGAGGSSYSAIDATSLTADEAALSFTSSASTGPKVISMTTSGSAWSASALSQSGNCFSISSTTSGTVTYGQTSGGSCTGAAASVVASSSSWSNTPPTQPLYPTIVSSMSSGLLGYWKFDETSGTTAADSSGSGNNGTLVNSPTTGASGLISSDSRKAFAFAAAGTTYVAPPSLGTLTQFTINLWVRTPASSSWNTMFAGSTFRFTLYPDGSCPSALRPSMWMKSGGYGSSNFASTCIAYSSVAMVTATSDGTTSRVYINGELAGSVTTVQTVNLTSPRIGMDGVSLIGTNDAFTGTIDEVSVWNRALSATEIANLHTAGA